MKIAMMTNNYKPFIGGVPISIERLSESLKALGHSIVVFAPNYAGLEDEEDVVRYRALIKGVAGGFSVPNVLDARIERRFQEGDFDVIHVHHPMMIGGMARYLSWKYHVPLVFTYHTRYEQYLHYIGLSGFKGLIPAYVRDYVSHCDMAIAPTPEMKDYLEQLHTGTEVRVMPTGLPADSFYPDEKRALGLRGKLAGDKRYLFCTVARLAKEKNLEFLLQSVKMFKEAFGDDFRLALVGDGPYRARLEAKTAALGLGDEVVFMGKVPNQEIKDYCCASDLFLFPSLSETQGIVLLEAMAAGTPVLALRATGTEDVVVNGRNGYMTEATEEDFICKLMEILEKKELDMLRQGARLTAEGYRCERVAQIAIAAYKGAILNKAEKERRNDSLRRGKTRAKEVWQ